MMYPKNELAQLVINQCVTFGIEDVVISPGSRNAPLTIGFSNHPDIKTYSIVDERCAAFFAMGIAQQKRKPVCVVCTSGSALLNYYPAVAEAFYSDISLVVIAADRPKHLIDVGDGQTIRQENVFANHSHFNANLDAENLQKSTDLTQKALQTAILENAPVHINVPFDEPLYELVDTIDEVTPFQTVTEIHFDEDISDYDKIWNNAKRKLILIGSNFPDKVLENQLAELVKDDSVLVFTETTSNLYNNKFINGIDKLLMPQPEYEFVNLQPEILLTLGGMVISKKVKQFLRKYQPKHHWHVDAKKAYDTYHCLDKHFKVEPSRFFEQFIPLISPSESTYQQYGLEKYDHRKAKHQEYLAKTDFSDLKVFETILDSLPKNIQLQVGNSSVIRYTQLFDLDSSLRVFCNRGTSGIDGSTSTAIGASLPVKEQTVFITGDISFFYDSNALWNTNIRNDFRIIVINNSGGGIFRYIPGPQTTNALNYFETPHGLRASELCNMFNVEYSVVDSLEDLKHTLTNFYALSNTPKLLEIVTPNAKNGVILREYFKFLR